MGGTLGFGASDTETIAQNYAMDPTAIARLQEIAESQQEMAEEAWGIYKTDYLPYEQKLLQANMDLIDPNRELMKTQIQAETGLTPERTETTRTALKNLREQIESEGRLLPEQEKATKAALGEHISDIERAGPVSERYYEEALEGINPEERMGEASADVEQAFGQSLGNLRRELSRAGVTPGSQRYQDIVSDTIYEKAKALAGARTTARRGAEEESYQRLTDAMGRRAGTLTSAGGAIAGRTSTAGTGATVTPYQTGSLSESGLGTTSSLASQSLSGASQTAAQGLKTGRSTAEEDKKSIGLDLGFGTT